MIPIAEPSLGEEELKNVVEAVKTSWISSKGKFIDEFEEKFARYCGRRYGVATSNGTVALHLALKTLGIGKGDEVIVPDLTFIATANAVIMAGAKPVLCDVKEDTFCLDIQSAANKINKKTKAIIPVHLYGQSADIINICKFEKKCNIRTRGLLRTHFY